MDELNRLLRQAIKAVPEVKVYLHPDTLSALSVKSKQQYINGIKDLVLRAYNNGMDVDTFTNRFNALIDKYLTEAYTDTWDEQGDGGIMPAQLRESLAASTAKQKSFVNNYYLDIIQARDNREPLNLLLLRADLWGTRYDEEVNRVISMIAALLALIGAGSAVAGVAEAIGATVAGGETATLESPNLEWVEGDTVEKCAVCLALDGIVAPKELWDELGVHPQQAPNIHLECGGWKCQCELKITDKPATENARQRILSAVTV